MPPRHLVGISTNQLLKQRERDKSQGISTLDIDAELKQRELEENIISMKSDIQKLTIPHWTRNWTFYLVVVSLVIALAALVLQWRADVRDAKALLLTSPVSAPSITSMPNSPSISTQKKPISQHKPVQKKP